MYPLLQKHAGQHFQFWVNCGGLAVLSLRLVMGLVQTSQLDIEDVGGQQLER